MPVEMYESRKESARSEDSEQISGGSVQHIILNPVNTACRRRQSDRSEAEILSVGFFILPDLRVSCSPIPEKILFYLYLFCCTCSYIT